MNKAEKLTEQKVLGQWWVRISLLHIWLKYTHVSKQPRLISNQINTMLFGEVRQLLYIGAEAEICHCKKADSFAFSILTEEK